MKAIFTTLKVLIVLLLLAAGLLWFFLPDMCSNEIYSEQISPNKMLKGVVFERSCGATTGFSTQISILPVTQKLENEGGNIFIVLGRPKEVRPKLHWLNNSELSIRYNQTGKPAMAKKAFNGTSQVQINYAK